MALAFKQTSLNCLKLFPLRSWTEVMMGFDGVRGGAALLRDHLQALRPPGACLSLLTVLFANVWYVPYSERIWHM